MSLSETLTQARQQASPDPARPLSFAKIRDRVKPLLLERTPTEQAISNLHSAKLCPQKPDPLVVWALAEVYQLDIHELDQDAAEAIDNVIAITEARRRHPQHGHARPTTKRRGASDLRKRDFPGTRVMPARAA